MEGLYEMIQTHPQCTTERTREIMTCIYECIKCASFCNICADACLSEKNEDLKECIKLNLLCAEVCNVTARALSTTKHTQGAILSLIESCKNISRLCGDECLKHAEIMDHCKICAEACFKCEDACDTILNYNE